MRHMMFVGLSLTALAVADPAAGQVIENGRWVTPEPAPTPTPSPTPAPAAETPASAPAPAPKVAATKAGPGEYRPPVRGWVLPEYWTAPRFRIADYAAWNLPEPTAGQQWVRYFDDAVLIDRYGRVDRTAGRVDWEHPVAVAEHRKQGAAVAATQETPPAPIARTPLPPSSAPAQDLPGSVAEAPSPPSALPPPPVAARAEVAENASSGRVDTVAGMEPGGGAGAAAGAAIDRAESADRGPPPQPGAGYPPPPQYADSGAQPRPMPPRPMTPRRWEPPVAPETAPDYGEPPVAPEHGEPPVAPERGYAGRGGYPFPPPPAPQVTCSGGCSSVVTTYSGGGYIANGYYYPPAVTTTITVNPAAAARPAAPAAEEWRSQDGTIVRRRVRRRQ
ncbi:RcnB family protein [Stakelama marina]|uniref:RcnB family protein n=1 Tax=Stakelama marina TaxID=2826939 RepID=A0A8T4IEF7_9SPHN|nr:RcnB family protein [Stakelama marina]MBR0552234.1 RcnB family protein [Stakelama marina]